MNAQAYYYGVFLGDGFVHQNHVQLKAIDRDFVEKWQDCVYTLFGKKYSIYSVQPKKKRRNPLYLCKVYGQDKVDELLRITKQKTEIPNFVYDGTDEIKLAFLQGLMDSEGWVALSLSPIKQSNFGLYFANTSRWTKDVWHLFKKLNIEVSELYLRKDKKKRDVYWFKIHILDYLEKGLKFNIQRKQRRLEFISRILTDYTHEYKGTRYSRPIIEK